jgi:hypothetical protein
MKWIKNKQKKDKEDWHLWFAWKPVVVCVHPDGNEEKVWGEYILRRFVYDTSGVRLGIGGFWKAEYKYKPEEWEWFQKEFRKEHGIPEEWDRPEPKVEVFRTDSNCSSAVCFSLSGEVPEEVYKPYKEHDPNTYLYTPPEEDERTELVCINCQKTVPAEEINEDNHGCLECQNLIYKPEFTDCEERVVPEIVGYYDPCSKCGSDLDENADCTNLECPLHYPEEFLNPSNHVPKREPWQPKGKHEIDEAWEVKHARRNKTIM